MTYTTSQILHKFFVEQANFDQHFAKVFQDQKRESSSLDDAYDRVAKKICQIEGYQEIVEALLTSENPRKITPQTFLDVWLGMLNEIENLLPTFDQEVSHHLLQVSQQLCEHLNLSAEKMTSDLLALKAHESLIMPLVHETVWGKTWENIVAYRKNAEGTFDIEFFHADANKKYPVQYYANVPEEDLFREGISIHVKMLFHACQQVDEEKHFYTWAFHPFDVYLEEPLFSRPILEHTHQLKAVLAFFYRCIWEKEKDNAVDSYKALLFVFRLLLTLSLKYSSKDKNLHTMIGLLDEASATSARHLSKLKENPLLVDIYASASDLLKDLKSYAERLLREFVPPDENLRQYKIAANQNSLIEKGVKNCIEHIAFADYRAAPPENVDFQYREAQEGENSWVHHFSAIECNVKVMQKANQDLVLGCINHELMETSLEKIEEASVSLSEQEIIHLLQNVTFIVEQLVKNAFQQGMRFSASVQNSGIKLLLIAYMLVEKLDKNNVLSHFKPACQGFMKLSKSPYFRYDSYKSYQDRQHLLSFIQRESDNPKTELFIFTKNLLQSFETTSEGIFADKILDAYSDFKIELFERYQNFRLAREQTSKPSISFQQYFFIELLSKSEQQGWIGFLSSLMQLAMHVHMLSDRSAIQQVGQENFVDIHPEKGFFFNLTYGRNLQRVRDFHVERSAQKLALEKTEHRNFFPKKKWVENQNATIHRWVKSNHDFSLILEEAASEPELMVSQLLSQMKTNLSYFQNRGFREFLESYLFKIIVDGKEERLPIGEEIKRYPHVFHTLLKSFLEASFLFLNSIEEGILSEESKCILSISIRVHEIAASLNLDSAVQGAKAMQDFESESLLMGAEHSQKVKAASIKSDYGSKDYVDLAPSTAESRLNCQSIVQTLEEYHQQIEKKLLKGCEKNKSGDFLFFLLKILPSEIPVSKLEDYLSWGNALQTQIEQRAYQIDPLERLWWNTRRYKIIMDTHDLDSTHPEDFQQLMKHEGSYLISLNVPQGKYEPIPVSFLKNPDFVALFSDRVRYWKMQKNAQEGYITFVDSLSGAYRLLSEQQFPGTLQRLIEGHWYLYLSPQVMTERFYIPAAIAWECVWWIHCEDLTVRGYVKSEPNRLWIVKNEGESFQFCEGVEKGLCVELMADEVQSDFEKYTAAFGRHFYAYRENYVADQLIDYRDLLIFPNIRTSDGEALIFERRDAEYYERGYPEKKLGSCLFAPSIFYQKRGIERRSTAIRIYGIEIQHQNKKQLRTSEETSLIIPFQKHVSDLHSHILYVQQDENIKPKLRSVEVIEIKTNSYGFCPETPKETLFAAYLLLAGKDYVQSMKMIKSIRPQHRLDSDEKKILLWMLEGEKESVDHSSSAAAIKIYVHQMLLGQGVEASSISLEEVQRTYWKRFSSVPSFLRILLERELPLITYQEEVFSKEKVSLRERWNRLEPVNASTISISSEFVQGIQNPSSYHRLLPGRRYPEGAFGYHYIKFFSEKTSEQEKWELIHVLEMLEVPLWIKNALKMALQKKRKLPKLTNSSYLENSRTAEEWINELFLSIPRSEKILTTPKNKRVIKKLSKDVFFVTQNSEDLLSSVFQKYKTMSPYEILHAFRKNFLQPVPSHSTFFSRIPCPLKIQSEDPLFRQELHAYRQEWLKGAHIRQQAVRYAVPHQEQLKAFQQVLKEYFSSVDGEGMKNNILRLLNRTPIDKDAKSLAQLVEITGHKELMDLDDAFHLIFIDGRDNQFAFLRSRNPYLIETDLDLLMLALQEYLEWHIGDRILEAVRENLKEMIHLSELNPAGWRILPDVWEAWQNIVELISQDFNANSSMEKLLFEYLAGFRIKEDQVQIIDRLGHFISSLQRSFIFQKLMGGGKTDVILRFVAKEVSRKGKVPLFLAHHSQYPALKTHFVHTQFKRLNQDVIDLNFHRQELASLKTLHFIESQLKKAMEQKLMVLMKSSFLLILRQEFIHQAYLHEDLSHPQVQALSRIRSFIKKNCVLFGDELDSILNVLEEVNFPGGMETVIFKNSLNLIKQVYIIFSTDPEISSLLNLKADQQSWVGDQKLRNVIFPHLVDHMIDDFPSISNLIPLKNSQQYRVQLKEYILGRGESSLVESLKADMNLTIQEGLAAVALLKGLCTEILPIVLSKGFKQRYGFSDRGEIIPYLGVGAANVTQFGYIYVKACCYFQGALNAGIHKEQLFQYRDKLREASLYYAELHHCPVEESVETRHFEALIGLPLHQEWSTDEVEKTLLEINESPQRCIDFYAEFSSTHLRYHTTLLRCGPVALPTMGAQFIGCSATLRNKETFNLELTENCELEEGVEGRIMIKFTQDLENQRSYFVLISDVTPREILHRVLEQRNFEVNHRLKALIDAGGLLKRYSNQQVAEEILRYEPLKEAVDAVVFLHQSSQREGFVLLKRGEDENFIFIPMETVHRREFERIGVSLDRLFVYFDELRATGSDIPLQTDALAVMTFDPFSTTMRTILQGAMRARGFFRSQNIDIVIPEQTLEGLSTYDPEKIPTCCMDAEGFFTTAIYNQTKMKKPQLLQSAFEQVREAYCSFIGEKLDEENWKFSQAVKWLFYSSFKDDPISLFLHNKQDVMAYELVEEYFHSVDKRFYESCLPYFDHSILQGVTKKAEEIVKQFKINLTWKTKKNGFFTSADIEVLIENQTQNQQEMHVQSQVDMQKELQKYDVKVDASEAMNVPWTPLKPNPTSFFDYEAPAFMTFPMLLKQIHYEASYDRIFPEDLYLTENFSRSHEVDLPVFHKAQKKAFHILLIKDHDRFFPLFIDLQEAKFWREQIQCYALSDCWLCDLQGHSLNEKVEIPTESMTTVKRAAWWGHFFNGNVSELRADRTRLQQELQVDHELKYRFLFLQSAHDPIQTKILNIDPILAVHPEKPSVFVFQDKKEEEAWFSQEIKELNAEQLQRLPLHFARFFKREQVPMIKRSGFFAYLLPENFQYVTPVQVKLIPDYRLRYLCLAEQIACVPKEKVCWLKGKGMKHISDEQLKFINPQELANLPLERQMAYQQWRIDRMGLKAFSQMIDAWMAPAVLPTCVPLIADQYLSYLSKREQLEQVILERFPYLRASQFPLLAAERWGSLTLKDYQKFGAEKQIHEEAKECIQQMPVEWVNEVDPRLARFFTGVQVRQILRPNTVSHLCSLEQLKELKASLAQYLEPCQLALLTHEHVHLIQALDEMEKIRALSDSGLELLTPSQIKRIDDRKTLLRLKEFSHLVSKQVSLLNPEDEKDQKVISQLHLHQIQDLDFPQILTLLPYLNDVTLKGLNPSVLGEAEDLPLEIRKKLTSSQIQCFLHSHHQWKDLMELVKQLTHCQWQEMDEVFIASFFATQPKAIVQCVPKTMAASLSGEALLKWFDRDQGATPWIDRFIGLCSLLIYPLVLLAAILAFSVSWSKSNRRGRLFRRIALSPLRLLHRVSYYRSIV